jgi:hypothetical protein
MYPSFFSLERIKNALGILFILFMYGIFNDVLGVSGCIYIYIYKTTMT